MLMRLGVTDSGIVQLITVMMMSRFEEDGTNTVLLRDEDLLDLNEEIVMEPRLAGKAYILRAGTRNPSTNRDTDRNSLVLKAVIRQFEQGSVVLPDRVVVDYTPDRWTIIVRDEASTHILTLIDRELMKNVIQTLDRAVKSAAVKLGTYSTKLHGSLTALEAATMRSVKELDKKMESDQ